MGFEPTISTVTVWHVRPLHHGAEQQRHALGAPLPFIVWSAAATCQRNWTALVLSGILVEVALTGRPYDYGATGGETNAFFSPSFPHATSSGWPRRSAGADPGLRCSSLRCGACHYPRTAGGGTYLH